MPGKDDIAKQHDHQLEAGVASLDDENSALRTSKNTVMLVAGMVVKMVGSFLFALYCAALLGVEGFGKYSIALFYFELFLSLSATAIGILLTRDLAKRPDRLKQLLSSALVMGTLLCFLAPLAVLPLGKLFNYSPDTIHAMGIACLALIPAAWCVILEAFFVTKERAEFVTGGATLEAIVRLGLSFGLLMAGFGFVELIWALAIARTVLLVAYWKGLQRVAPFKFGFSFQSTWSFFKRWRTFAAENWMATIYTNLDVLVLSFISGEVAVGLYSAAWKLVRLGSVFAKSYTTAVFPVMSRLYSKSRDQFHILCRQTIRAMALVTIPAAIAIVILADRLIQMLFTPEYAEAVPILRVLIWTLFAEFVNPFLSHALFAQGKQRKSMNVAAVSLFFNVIATYLLVSRYGAVGAAAGTVFSGLVAMVCYFAYLLPPAQIAKMGIVFARLALAATGVGATAYLLRDASWPLLVGASVAVYVPLLWITGSIQRRDTELLKLLLKGDGVQTDMKNIRVGVIGCGAIAECYHLPALASNKHTRDGIVLADLNTERAQVLADKFNASEVCGDFRELEGKVDAVIVATPPTSHHPISRWFLERGIHVLCEKPLTEEIADARDLINCARDNNAYLLVNQTRRFFPAYQKIRELISEGVLGDLVSIDYHDGVEFDWPAASPHHFRPDARGAWSDTGVHLLDSVLYWIDGKPELVSSENDADGGPEALATVKLKHQSCDITIKVSRLGRLMNGFRIEGTKGVIESDAENWANVVVQFKNGRRKKYNCPAGAFQKYTDFAHPLIDNLVASVSGSGVPFVSGESTLATIELLEAAYENARLYDMSWNAIWKEPVHGA